MFQRLQQRMNKQKVIQESEPELFSFYPEAEDGMSLALLQLTDWLIYYFIIIFLNTKIGKTGLYITINWLCNFSIFCPCSGVSNDHAFPASGGIWQASTKP